jgi:prepilin-type N-terminal cleavage/methylation domain-containing protein
MNLNSSILYYIENEMQRSLLLSSSIPACAAASASRRNPKSPPLSPRCESIPTSPSKGEGWRGGRGFTMIEIIVVIVILAIAAGITVKFVVDGLKIYTMTVNQKTLFDEGKLALERMCRDIRDANAITGTTASSVTFVRSNATVQDGADEVITFRWNGGANPLEKVKGGIGYAMVSNVNAFTVTNAANEIQLLLTLRLASGENVTLQTRVYPKNLPRDGMDTTYKNFCQNWMEAIQ